MAAFNSLRLPVFIGSLLLVGQAHAEPVTSGWIENAWFGESGIKFKAKLDTGANTSSINAPRYEEFDRDGARWVRFQITNSEGQDHKVESKIMRVAKIRRTGVASVSRPVILLDICIAGQKGTVEFTLADRTGMNYQVLIGRTFLAGRILVDSSRTYLRSRSTCA